MPGWSVSLLDYCQWSMGSINGLSALVPLRKDARLISARDRISNAVVLNFLQTVTMTHKKRGLSEFLFSDSNKRRVFLAHVYTSLQTHHIQETDFTIIFLLNWISICSTANIISFTSTYYEVLHGFVSQWCMVLPCCMLLHLPVCKWPLQLLAFFLATLNLLFYMEEIYHPCQFGGRGERWFIYFLKKINSCNVYVNSLSDQKMNVKLIWFSWTASCTLQFYMIRDFCTVDSYNSYKNFSVIDQFQWKQSS